jgi:hypothetical protein
MVLEPASAFAPVVRAAARKVVSELQDLEVSSYSSRACRLSWLLHC